MDNVVLLEYNSETLDFLRKEFDLDTPERIEEAVRILEDWLDKQAHFVKKKYSRDYLERCLILSKGSVEKVKTKLDKIATYRSLLPEYFEPIPDARKQRILDDFLMGFAPKMSKDHYRLFMMKNIAKQYDPSEFIDFYRYFVMITEYIHANDLCNGFVAVFDYSEANIFDVLKVVNVMELHQFVRILVDGFSLRIKGLHFISPSKAIDMIVTLIKQVLNPKVAGRIHIHKTIEELYDYIPLEIMPKDYGGQAKPLFELSRDLKAVLSSEENVKYFKEMQYACTNENMRREDTFNDLCLGMPGSFRKLNVD